MRRIVWHKGLTAGLAAVALVVLHVPAAGAARSLVDRAITAAVENELLFDQATPLNEITVRTSDGVVSLTGTVDNVLAKDRSTKIAETVKGVRSVINRIKVKPSVLRTDMGIKSDVEAGLLRDPATKSWKIEAGVSKGKVTLTGTVGSWAQKQLAEKVAKSVSGVVDVDNNIEIRYKHERADSQIGAEVRKRLRWDVLVDDALVKAKVQNNRVKLTGTVGSAAERRRAAADAWVAGVEDVDISGLEVKKWARSPQLRKNKYVSRTDVQIRRAVKDALLYDPRVMSFNVTPKVDKGVVTLRGEVDNLKAKRAAESATRHTVGVILVRNRLKVQPSTPPDSKVASSIRASLSRDPWVDRRDVNVRVTDGVAHLSGEVESYFEKYRTDQVASGVYGVVDVRNRIEVKDTRAPISYNPYLYETYLYGYDWYDYAPYHTFKPDGAIERDIKDELFWSPFINSRGVNIEVDSGVATLKGKVDTWGEFHAATEEAYEGGAVWVKNKMKVD